MKLLRITTTGRGRGANINEDYAKELLLNSSRFINWVTQGTGCDFFYQGVTDGGKLQQLSYRTATNKAGVETLLGEADNAQFIDIPFTGVTEANWPASATHGVTVDKIILGYDNDAGTDSFLWIATESGKALKVKSSLTIAEIDDLALDIIPVASAVAFTGTEEDGELLTGTYTYFDEGGETEAGTTFAWYRADDAAGLNEAAIGSATSLTYTLVTADVAKFVRLGVTPKNADGTGAEAYSAYSGAIGA